METHKPVGKVGSEVAVTSLVPPHTTFSSEITMVNSWEPAQPKPSFLTIQPLKTRLLDVPIITQETITFVTEEISEKSNGRISHQPDKRS